MEYIKMKEALEKIMDELRSTADKSKNNNQKQSDEEEIYPGKWDYYVETD